MLLLCHEREPAVPKAFLSPVFPRFPIPGSVPVRPAALGAVADAMNVVGQFAQHHSELLEAQLLVIVQVGLLEEVFQISGFVPVLEFWGQDEGKGQVPAPPPWEQTEFLGSPGRVWEVQDVLTLLFHTLSPKNPQRGRDFVPKKPQNPLPV